MSEDQYIITTLLRAQLHEAREAIRAIDAANMGILQGTTEHSDLEEAINSAVAILPESEQARQQFEKQQPKKRRRRSTTEQNFEDLF